MLSNLPPVQDEQGLDLTVDLVHFGHRYAELAADVLEENLGGISGMPRGCPGDVQGMPRFHTA